MATLPCTRQMGKCKTKSQVQIISLRTKFVQDEIVVKTVRHQFRNFHRIFAIYLESRKPQTDDSFIIAVPQPAPGVRLCAQDSFPSWMYTLWIPIIMFELLVLLLSLSLAVKYYQSMKLMRENCTKPTDSLQYILLRDSITFPFMYVIYRYICLPS